VARILFLVGVLILIGEHLIWAQSSPWQFQPKDEESPPQLLSTAEFAALGDPLLFPRDNWHARHILPLASVGLWGIAIPLQGCVTPIDIKNASKVQLRAWS
jgi:hypothetical protein